MNLWSKAIYCCSDYCFTAMYFNSTENAIDMWTAIATTCTQLWWLKTAARNSIFWNMCVDSICLGEHLFVNLDKSSGKKMDWHRTERKKTKEKQSKRLIQWTFWLWNRNKSVAVSVRLLSHIIFWFVHLLAFIYLLRTRARD